MQYRSYRLDIQYFWKALRRLSWKIVLSGKEVSCHTFKYAKKGDFLSRVTVMYLSWGMVQLPYAKNQNYFEMDLVKILPLEEISQIICISV